MNSRALDIARQATTVAGAIFQVAAGALGGPEVARIANENASTILPAGYAFAIWTPIFILAAIYAVWQALPANRARPVLRRVGWLIAAGYIGNGLWELLFPAERFLSSQIVITAILAVLAIAYVRTSRAATEHALTRAERWLVAMPLGIFFGWITAATFVGLGLTLRVNGIADAGSAAVGTGVALLLAGGALAITMIWVGRSGPREGWLAYAAAVIWALAGVAVNQLSPSPITGGLAVTIAAGVLGMVVWRVAATADARRTMPSTA